MTELSRKMTPLLDLTVSIKPGVAMADSHVKASPFSDKSTV